MNSNVVLLAACYLLANSSATDICPVRNRYLDWNIATQQFPKYFKLSPTLFSINMNCVGALYGINILASDQGRVLHAVARKPMYGNQSETFYNSILFNEVMVEKGLNIIELDGVLFHKNDTVLLLASSWIISKDSGYTDASVHIVASYLETQLNESTFNISSLSAVLNSTTHVPVMLVFKESFESSITGRDEGGLLKFDISVPLRPIQAAQIKSTGVAKTKSQAVLAWSVYGLEYTTNCTTNSNSITLIRLLWQFRGRKLNLTLDKINKHHELVFRFPVYWSWSSWSNWTNCTSSNSSDGTMVHSRTRQCVYNNQQASFKNCPGSHLELFQCVIPCNECKPSCFPCGGILTCKEGQISSQVAPNGLYYADQNCNWTIQRPVGFLIELTFSMLEVGTRHCRSDRIEVFDEVEGEECLVGVLCLADQPIKYTSRSNTARISFITNSFKERTGFTMTYNSFEANETNRTVPATCQSCGGTLTSTNGTLVPKLSLDGSYLPRQICHWTINCSGFQSMAFYFENVDFNTSLGYIEVKELVGTIEHTFHVTSNETLYTQCNVVNVTFYTSGNRIGPGFRILYNALNWLPLAVEPMQNTAQSVMATSVNKNSLQTVTSFYKRDMMMTYGHSPSSAIASVSSSTLPQEAPPKTFEVCKVNLLIDWSSWNECVPNNQEDIYGTKSRERVCKQAVIRMEGGCFEGSTTKCSIDEKSSLDGIPNTCNLTCIRDDSFVCNSSFNSSQLGCTASQQQNKTCRAGKKCVFYLYGQWSTWSTCHLAKTELAFSNGARFRSRVCTKTTYVTKFSRRCILTYTNRSVCPIDKDIYKTRASYQSPYSPYQVCSSTCINNATQSCKANIKLAERCEGPSTEQTPCNVTRHTVTLGSQLDCNVTSCGPVWASWGDCAATCGSATRSRFALCTKADACDGRLKQSEDCGLAPCPVDGAWTEWGSWSECSKPCNGGIRTRLRLCDNPASRFGGFPCFGPSTENLDCNLKPCPVDGQFGPWSSWSYCDQPCGAGRMWRRRRCDSPEPANDGLPCSGADAEHYLCNQHQCRMVQLNAVLELASRPCYPSYGLNQSLSTDPQANVLNDILQVFNASDMQVNATADCYNNSSFISCDILVRFESVPTDGIVLFQNQIEDVGCLGSMSISKWNLTSAYTPNAPAMLTCQALSRTEIHLKWDYVIYHKEIAGYVIFYREFGTSTWERIATSPLATNHTVSYLKQFTLYTFRVSASITYANGISTDFKDCITNEGVPLLPPQNLTCRTTSSNSLYLEWDHLPDYDWHGVRNAYYVEYRPYHGTRDWRNISVSSDKSFYCLTSLKGFAMYEVKVSAATRTGKGPSTWTFCKTAEEVPSAPPSNLQAALITHDGSILVQWNELPGNLTNGILLGYQLCYSSLTLSDTSLKYGKEVCSHLLKYATAIILEGFSLNIKLRFSIAGFTAAGPGPRSSPVFVETCACPRRVYVSWYQYKPYIYHTTTGYVTGILASLIQQAIQHSCTLCDGKTVHNFGNVTIYFNRTKSGRHAKLKDDTQLRNRLSDDAHAFMPVLVNQINVASQDKFKLVLVVEDPGCVLLVRGESSKLSVLINIIVAAWPPVFLCLMLGTLVGLLLWTLERKQNPEEFNINSYIRGLFSGVWWGFITMTTVGYGDITPRSYYGKAIAIIWMLVGPVLNGIVIGIITTGLTASVVKSDTNLNGKVVAVVANSSQYYFAVRRNAKLFDGVVFTNNGEITAAMESGIVDAAIMNSISAAAMKNTLKEKNIRIARFFENPHGLGLVLTSELSLIKNRIEEYFKGVSVEILKKTKSFTDNLEDEGASENDQSLFLQLLEDKEAFSASILYLCSLIITISLVCLLAKRVYTSLKTRHLRRVLPSRSGWLSKRKEIEEQLFTEMKEELEKFETKFHNLDKKHSNEQSRWLAQNKYYYGFPGWLKFGTTKNDVIVRKIKYDDIMITDL